MGLVLDECEIKTHNAISSKNTVGIKTVIDSISLVVGDFYTIKYLIHGISGSITIPSIQSTEILVVIAKFNNEYQCDLTEYATMGKDNLFEITSEVKDGSYFLYAIPKQTSISTTFPINFTVNKIIIK